MYERPAHKMWAGLKCVKFSWIKFSVMATFQKETRTSHSTNSHLSLEKISPVRQLFQTGWFQVASLAAIGTGRTIQYHFDLKNNHRTSNKKTFSGRACSQTSKLMVVGCFHFNSSTNGHVSYWIPALASLTFDFQTIFKKSASLWH